jgi:hypothetical protein
LHQSGLRLACVPGQHPEHVVCLSLGATIGCGLCEREGLARERGCAFRSTGVVQREGEIGLYARPQAPLVGGGRIESGQEARLRELPFSAAKVDATQLVLDRCERRGLGLGCRAFVTRQSAAVIAEQSLHVADPLVQSGGVRVAQGERGLEMLERVGVSVQRCGMLRGEAVVLRRARVIAGQAQVRSDEGRACRTR